MKFLTDDIEELVGGKFCYEEDPVEAAHRMMEHMDRKRAALKLRPLMYARPMIEPEPEPEAKPLTAAKKAVLPTTDGKKGCA